MRLNPVPTSIWVSLMSLMVSVRAPEAACSASVALNEKVVSVDRDS
jgi:hypothetical protein